MTVIYRESYVIIRGTNLVWTHRYTVEDMNRLSVMWVPTYKARLRSNVMVQLALIWARSTL